MPIPSEDGFYWFREHNPGSNKYGLFPREWTIVKLYTYNSWDGPRRAIQLLGSEMAECAECPGDWGARLEVPNG